MKKLLLALLVSLSVFSWSYGQEQGPVDLILVLDTSTGMSHVYRELRDYITGPFLREFLRLGDTFHLISFSDAPWREISRRVESAGDVETIIGRLCLMYPLDPSANIAAALDYTERYVAGLPETRRKIVALITGEERVPADAAVRLSRGRTEFHLIRFPFTGSGPVSGRRPRPASSRRSPATPAPPAVEPARKEPAVQAVSPQTSKAIQAEAAQASPAPLQEELQPAVTAPPPPPPVHQIAPTVQPHSPPQRTVGRPEGMRNAAVPPERQPSPPPPSRTTEAARPQAELRPAGEGPDTRVLSPKREKPAGKPWPSLFTPERIPRTPLLRFFIMLGLGLTAFLTLIFFQASGRLQRFPNMALAYAANRRRENGGKRPTHHIPDTETPLAEGMLMLSLFVEDQSTAIGRRNMHAVKSGCRYTIGGGKSDYLIFLAPLPHGIAELRCDDITCTFVPRKPRFFPDIGSTPLPDCIGKTIRIISEKKYELFIRLERCEDPLKSLNRLLQSIKPPVIPAKIETGLVGKQSLYEQDKT